MDRAPPGAVIPAALLEAQVLREQGRYRESAALFDSISRYRVVGEDPSTAASSRVWSMAHEAGALAEGGDSTRLGALADTIQISGALSNLARDNRLHHHVRALLFVARGDDASAVAEFRRSIFSTSFGYSRTSVELAKALMRLGRNDDAIAILEASLRGSIEAQNLYATRTEIRLQLAQAYAAAGRRPQANEQLELVRRAWEKSDPEVRPQFNTAVRAVANAGSPAARTAGARR